jgi:hypothetical protein
MLLLDGAVEQTKSFRRCVGRRGRTHESSLDRSGELPYFVSTEFSNAQRGHRDYEHHHDQHGDLEKERHETLVGREESVMRLTDAS